MNEKLNELYEEYVNYFIGLSAHFSPISYVFVIFNPKSKYASWGLKKLFWFLHVFNTFSLFLSSLANTNANINSISIK